MPYITSFERIGHKKGLEEGLLQKSREDVLEVLETRFETVPQPIAGIITGIINGIDDLSVLKALLKEAVKTTSLEEFRQALEKISPSSQG